jgi:hypothetical protein
MRILKKGQTCFVVEKEREHFIIQQVLRAYLTTVGLLLSKVLALLFRYIKLEILKTLFQNLMMYPMVYKLESLLRI